MDAVGFYVTATDGRKYFPMFGPVESKEAAEAIVDSVSMLARKIDPTGRADFMAWGVSKITMPELPMGWFNKRVSA